MIKALYFESCPNMDSVSAVELLDELNPLIKDSRGSTILSVGNSERKIYKDSFITQNYFITFNKIEDEDTLKSILKIYEVMQLSIPSFLKVINIGNSVIVAIPRYDDAYENASYTVMIDELVRFTAYCLKKTGDDIVSSMMLKEYVDMYVSYPGNRGKTYKKYTGDGK